MILCERLVLTEPTTPSLHRGCVESSDGGRGGGTAANSSRKRETGTHDETDLEFFGWPSRLAGIGLGRGTAEPAIARKLGNRDSGALTPRKGVSGGLRRNGRTLPRSWQHSRQLSRSVPSRWRFDSVLHAAHESAVEGPDRGLSGHGSLVRKGTRRGCPIRRNARGVFQPG